MITIAYCFVILICIGKIDGYELQASRMSRAQRD